MNTVTDTIVGVLLLVTGTVLFLTAIMLAVGEVISGRHRSNGPRGATMAGLDWTGIGAVLNGAAAVLGALKDWPLAGLFMLFGVILDAGGIWILAAKPI